MNRIKGAFVRVNNKDKVGHLIENSDWSGNFFLVKVTPACLAQLTSLAKYRCLKLNDRAKSTESTFWCVDRSKVAIG